MGHWHSSPDVAVCAGVQVTDAEGLKAAGIQPAEVARLVSRTFCDMIYLHGHVHCDPHAANLFVRKQQGKVRPCLLLCFSPQCVLGSTSLTLMLAFCSWGPKLGGMLVFAG